MTREKANASPPDLSNAVATQIEDRAFSIKGLALVLQQLSAGASGNEEESTETIDRGIDQIVNRIHEHADAIVGLAYRGSAAAEWRAGHLRAGATRARDDPGNCRHVWPVDSE